MTMSIPFLTLGVNVLERSPVGCVWTHHELRLILAYALPAPLVRPDAPYFAGKAGISAKPKR